MLAAAGKEVEHDVPSLQERLQMHYLELKVSVCYRHLPLFCVCLFEFKSIS